MPIPSKSAMIVEDDGNFCVTAELMLRRIGFKSVVVTEDADLAWIQLNFMRFDFVLSNSNLEPFGGLQLLRRVRGNPQFCGTRFVLMSAELSLESWREAIDAGAADFLLKPFTWQKLRETVEIAFSTPSEAQTNVIKFPIRPGGKYVRRGAEAL